MDKELKEYIDQEINKLRIENEINQSHIVTLYEKIKKLEKEVRKNEQK
jgi:hypothetical protein